ncbi:iso-IS10R ORF [Neiella marina]|uniref:Iso-IS10R ORF n=2 Tax=Neiella marina TaxID=508461 RepID=A0A8J2UBF3_9GAMM|nr:IS4 family transposase [Neiella marina]GGA91267.1 iso-IS10R ORF [Neiella marina]
MRDVCILHDLLKNQCPSVHNKRLKSLMTAVQSLLDGHQLSLTELGRNIPGSVAAKHNIKRIDRLLGNGSLHQERLAIYRWHARLLCGANPMPIILVDWSDVREQMRHQTLRASVSFEGRSVTIYERVFAFAEYNSPVSHNPFIDELASILPANCCPLVVTDAGYRNPWFRAIEAKGWFWLGRVRGEVGFRPKGDKHWHSNKSYYPTANAKARFLGQGELGRKSPIYAALHLYKSNPKGRNDARSSKAGRHHTAQQSYRRNAKEPWLLATNLPPQSMTSKQLVNLYAKRMQIEESFRDIKSPQYGLGLRHSNSRCPKRFDILLLIAMLAEWALRLIGMVAIKNNWVAQFQANTIKHRRVLSLIRLGREVRKRWRDYPISSADIRWAIGHYIKQIHQTGMPEL